MRQMVRMRWDADVQDMGRVAGTLAMLALLAMLSGCETVDAMTGKDRLQQDLERARTESRARIGEEKERVQALEQEKRGLRAQLDLLETQHSATLAELETLRRERSSAAGRINVFLFRGDIVYAIVPAAYGDYRAALRLLAVNDSNFGEELTLFEKLEGGDAALLHVLRQIDGDDDRIIGLEEARGFREQQEDALKHDSE